MSTADGSEKLQYEMFAKLSVKLRTRTSAKIELHRSQCAVTSHKIFRAIVEFRSKNNPEENVSRRYMYTFGNVFNCTH